MRAPIIAVALALMPGVAAAAEPAKSDSKPPATARPAPAKVVLASADDRHGRIAATLPDTAPAKRRVARVTTCRCGDPQPDEGQQDQ